VTTLISNPKAYRLPTHVYPTRYDIEIDARLGRRETHGKVTIQLDIRESKDTIELHARDMKLSNATLTVGGETLEGEIEQDNERNMASIRFDEPLPVGEATLDITFDGEVSKGLEGLYLAKDGPEECLCTQCEEIDARRIFPCFDEPTFKASFAWKVTTSPDVTVLANGPLVTAEESEDGKSKTWTFAPTKPMSSYLVALVIGDVAGTEEEVISGKPIRVYGLKGKEHMGQFAHGYTARLLPWYEEYFGAEYHFDKYDQVAVPGFSAGAMENSGLVLFRQPYLLMDPRTASFKQEQVIALVVAHEFAHMWFGNLVTMKWWDDLWLNEAFAEWMAYKAVNTLSPEYEVWNDFQGGKNAALAADAQESTHPIYSPVETPAQASELFDVITYQKGSSVMRMLENFLGNDGFRAGLRTYMQEFSESNAVGHDLWRHLQAASHHPVTAMMESWINQSGYPVVSISLEGSGGDTKLSLSQTRFYSSPNPSNVEDQTWQVPLVVRYEDGEGLHETRYLLAEKEASLPLEVSGELKWCYANADEIGFYRQNPDETLLSGLLANLDKLSPLEQMGLLGDQWALVRNATHNIPQFLEVLSAMLPLEHYSITEEVVGHLHNLERLLESAGDKAALAKFREWVGGSFKGKLEKLGFTPGEGEGKDETQRRTAVVDAMATLAHDAPTIEKVTELADQEASDPTSVDANLAGTLVAAAAQFGDGNRFDRYVELYLGRKEGSSSPQETNRYLYSFAAFRQEELVDRVLKLMDDGTIPQEGIGPVLRQMFSLRHAQVPAWNYVKRHWDTTIHTLGNHWVSGLVISSGQLPAKYRDELVAFYDENLKGEAERGYARCLETMDQMAEFKARTEGDLVGWFKEL
jgi:puromycin-sensitive aminopeptidase